MSIIVTTHRPIVPAPQEAYWGQPIRAQTLTQMTVCAAHMATVKGLMHVTRRYEYNRHQAGGGAQSVLGLNPTGQDVNQNVNLAGRSGEYQIDLPHTNPWATGIEVAITYQGHGNDLNADTSSSSFGLPLLPLIQLRLINGPGGNSQDPTQAAVAAGAQYATQAGGLDAQYPLDVDGRVEDPAYAGGYRYPVKRVLFVAPPAATAYSANQLPSTPRSLRYQGLDGASVTLSINWENVRILQVDINERPPLIIEPDSGGQLGNDP